MTDVGRCGRRVSARFDLPAQSPARRLRHGLDADPGRSDRRAGAARRRRRRRCGRSPKARCAASSTFSSRSAGASRCSRACRNRRCNRSIDGIPLTDGAERLVATLRRLGYKTAILSGGFTFFGRVLQAAARHRSPARQHARRSRRRRHRRGRRRRSSTARARPQLLGEIAGERRLEPRAVHRRRRRRQRPADAAARGTGHRVSRQAAGRAERAAVDLGDGTGRHSLPDRRPRSRRQLERRDQDELLGASCWVLDARCPCWLLSAVSILLHQDRDISGLARPRSALHEAAAAPAQSTEPPRTWLQASNSPAVDLRSRRDLSQWILRSTLVGAIRLRRGQGTVGCMPSLLISLVKPVGKTT